MIDLKKVLIPTDFSETSDKALQYGAEFAVRFGAELHLLHAFEILPIAYGELLDYPPPDAVASAASARLEKLPVESHDLPVIRKVMQGPPFVEILRYAKEQTIDLIVMGTHGHGAIAHLLLGNVAERVVRKAPCPVLVVRPDEHEFVVP